MTPKPYAQPFGRRVPDPGKGLTLFRGIPKFVRRKHRSIIHAQSSPPFLLACKDLKVELTVYEEVDPVSQGIPTVFEIFLIV